MSNEAAKRKTLLNELWVLLMVFFALYFLSWVA
jgi:hypothetical protein